MTKTTLGQKIVLQTEPLELPTKHPFGISRGTTSISHNLLIKLRLGDLTGYGEASPVSYHHETLETAACLLKKFQEMEIVGDDPFAIAEVSRQMDKVVEGHCSVKAAIEMAMHDLCGKIAGLPTYKMLGLSGHPQPMTDLTIGIASLEMIEKKVHEAVEAGFKVLKVKQGTDYDREIIKKVRKAAPDLPLRVDANGAWSPKRAIEMSHFLSDNNVQFIEQPLPKSARAEDFRFVKERSPIPIYADESVCRAHDVVRLADSIDGVVVKLAKTGGLLEALKVIHTARAHSLEIMFGCMLESSVGITAAAHLSGLVDHLDLDGALLLVGDPFTGAVFDNGYLRLPDKPGLGVSPA